MMQPHQLIPTSCTSSAHGCLIYIFLLNKSASFKRQYGGCVTLAPFCCCVTFAPDDANRFFPLIRGEISSRGSNPQKAQLQHIADLCTNFQLPTTIPSCQKGCHRQTDGQTDRQTDRRTIKFSKARVYHSGILRRNIKIAKTPQMYPHDSPPRPPMPKNFVYFIKQV